MLSIDHVEPAAAASEIGIAKDTEEFRKLFGEATDLLVTSFEPLDPNVCKSLKAG